MNRTWEWSLSGYDVTNKSPKEICDLCREIGAAGIEGAPPLYEGLSESQLQKIGELFRNEGVKIQTFHLPFSHEYNIASFYETLRKQAVEGIQRWMERGATLGASIMILHPSSDQFNITAEGIDKYKIALSKSIEELLLIAKRLNVTIALENMPPRHGIRFGSLPEHFEFFAKEFKDPNFGFCLDVGHALMAVYDDANLFFKVMGNDIKAFHLQDNAGDRDSHLAPGRGLVNWEQVFQEMTRMQFSSTLKSRLICNYVKEKNKRMLYLQGISPIYLLLFH